MKKEKKNKGYHKNSLITDNIGNNRLLFIIKIYINHIVIE